MKRTTATLLLLLVLEPAFAGERGLVCREELVVDEISPGVELYGNVDRRLVTEQPTSDPLVVRCQVCVLSGPDDTIRFGAKSVGRCESRDFEVLILSGGLGDGERRPDQCAAGRVHGDKTTVPVLAKGKTDHPGRLWTYVRDDRPFAGPAPPAAIFYYSRDRGGEHPKTHLAGYSGILQADAYAGFNDLYAPLRKPVPLSAGRTADATSSSWRRSRGRHWLWKPCDGSTPSSMSSARSTDWPPSNVWRCVRRRGTPGRRTGDLDARCSWQAVAPR